ncbi:MAG: type II toxin-antitoxin system RelE/ParE family toxin [Roseiflexus sp.]|uniref:type II toxin-antitoxin system RelE family toxin n=1 Tax=Roseiflexus sp. TaxID=2562120 RepID=UPI0025F8C3A7|nr:type II toxin-antitoxin system RelE/ParE family toxin [Roseiflexus sp.]MCL6539166.1 type II toxin-antitoxin system RelE/ParE family toxin [Roseiflexus sp.]
MRVIYRLSFAKDLKKIRSKKIRQQVQRVLEAIEHCTSPGDIPNIKRLTAEGPYYRIRIGDYRMGLVIDGDTVSIVRFLHRREIYRYFP